MGCTFHTLCPVAVSSYLPGPLLIFQDGSTLSKRKLSSALNAALEATAFNSGKYTGQSFRIGAATAAAAAGLEDSLIKSLGRWQSAAFQKYIHTPASVLCTASKRIASSSASKGLH